MEYTAQDIIKNTRLGSKTNKDIISKYDPEKFWEDYGKIYLNMFMEAAKDEKKLDETIYLNTMAIVARIDALKPKSVLEVGCGFGRCMPFVRENVKSIERLEGIEFSSTMIEESKKYLKTYPRGNEIKIIQGNAKDLPYKDKEFDLIYTHVCLTHIPPKDIPRVTSEISRVAKSHIVHIERFNYPYEHPNPHRWSHMLTPYYTDLGWEQVEMDTCNKFEEHKTKAITLRR